VPSVVLAIAGNIGSGKTTLTSRLSERLHFTPLFEPEADNPYLADFYQDMARWALPTQLRFLVSRIAETQHALASGASIICDRTCWEDAEIFAANLHGRGAMDDRDFETYELVAQRLLSAVRPPDLLVYLRRPVASCRAQIASRGRAYEDQIPTDYLLDLEARYDRWFEGWKLSEKVFVRAEDHDFLRSDDDLSTLVARITEALPQRELRFG
jgi:deoxyadenosine/deoxycytidine kinase